MNPQKLLNKYDRIYEYWTDGQKVYFNFSEIKGVDIESFQQYPGSWAKDKKNCYSSDRKLQGANIESFKVLNFTYAKDDRNVWTLAGSLKDVDAKTFEVCDNGKFSLGKDRDKKTGIWYELFVPHGFGKDKNNVYYYDFQGKPSVVKNALVKTFVSLDDGRFGYDEKNVFCGKQKLPKVDAKTWQKINDSYNYSKDKKSIYYLGRIIKDADYETFQVIEKKVERGLPKQLARDKNNYYWNDSITPREKIEELIK